MIVVLSTPLVAPLVLLLTSVWSTGEAVKPPPVMFRGDPEHTGYSSSRFFGGQGGIRWRVQTGGAVRSSPAVTASRVFVGSGDGTRNWGITGTFRGDYPIEPAAVTQVLALNPLGKGDGLGTGISQRPAWLGIRSALGLRCHRRATAVDPGGR
jgi:PQQ-like domain